MAAYEFHRNLAASPLEGARRVAQSIGTGVNNLRFHLEAALADPCQPTLFDEPAIEKWPRPIRAAIVAGAALLLWSLIALSIWASVR